jgi:hypothetical protein
VNSFTDSLTGFPRLTWHVLCTWVFVGSWAFPVMYAIDNKWKNSEMGRHLMTFSSSVAFGVSAYMSRMIWGDYPGRAVVMFSAMILLVGSTWWRAVIFLRARRGERRRV